MTVEYNFDENETGEFMIYDLLGNKLLTQAINGKTSRATINVKGLATGIYTYKCVGSQFHSYSGKIVIE